MSKFILKKINDFTYSLKMSGDNSIYLYNIIKKILQSCIFDNETNSIFFSAENLSIV